MGFGLGRGGNPGLIVIMVEGCHPGWEGPSVSSLIAAEGAETAELWAALPQRGRGSAGLAVRPAGGRNPDGFALARMDFSVPLSILLICHHSGWWADTGSGAGLDLAWVAVESGFGSDNRRGVSPGLGRAKCQQFDYRRSTGYPDETAAGVSRSLTRSLGMLTLNK